ncbi:MAG: FAD-dependent monooxygenase [Vicinamibacterales bacterium]
MPDVVICGAGPAGAMAAVILARAGVSVRLLDRARFPREKLCGDTLNPGALAVLARHGLSEVARSGVPISGMVVTDAAGVRVEGVYGPDITGRSLPRSVLDTALLRAAEAAGAAIEEGVLVRAPRRADGRVRGVSVAGRQGADLHMDASLTIAADGASSRLARALSLAHHAARPRRWAAGAYFEDVSGMSRFGEMHVRAQAYIGIAPLPEGVANACVVTADRAAAARPEALLHDTLRSDPVLAERFSGARRITRVICLGPLAVESTGCGVPGLVLAGDSAGFIDPMTGDGLHFALRGAELAAAEVLHALEHGRVDAHLRLAVMRRREFARKWLFNKALRSLVGSPVAVRAAALGAKWSPGWLHQTIRYAGDLRVA